MVEANIVDATLAQYKQLYESLVNLDVTLGAGLTAFTHTYEALQNAAGRLNNQAAVIDGYKKDIDLLKHDLEAEIKANDYKAAVIKNLQKENASLAIERGIAWAQRDEAQEKNDRKPGPGQTTIFERQRDGGLAPLPSHTVEKLILREDD